MSANFLPSLKTYTLTASERRRFQQILDGTDSNDAILFFLKQHEKESLRNIISQWLEALDQKQLLLRQKLAELTGLATNEQVHENNRLKIYNAVQQHILQHKAMPNYQQVAQLTGISRQTVAKHMNEHLETSDDTVAQYNYAAKGLLDMILHDATKHRNIVAARYYLSALDKMTAKAASPAYVVMGTHILSQSMFNNLVRQQQEAILNILQPLPKLDIPRMDE